MKKILKYTLDNKLFNNTELLKKYLNYLFYCFFDISCNIVTSNYILSLKCFHPLPTMFSQLSNNNDDKISISGNILQFIGKPNGNRIITSNRILPHCIFNPIPFTFPIYLKNEIKLVNSNVYYYEIEILEKTRDSWENETIVIGYGTIKSKIQTNPGWHKNTFGYHLDDGTFQYNSICIKNFGPKCYEGDIIGAGIIYVDNNKYKPFFTYNGLLLSFNLPIIDIYEEITPMIGYDSPHKIKYNFSSYEFKFNIETLINSSKIISSNNYFFMNEQIDFEYASNIKYIKKKIFLILNYLY